MCLLVELIRPCTPSVFTGANCHALPGHNFVEQWTLKRAPCRPDGPPQCPMGRSAELECSCNALRMREAGSRGCFTNDRLRTRSLHDTSSLVDRVTQPVYEPM